uniref:WD repeat-containing protein 79 n=1 Tax=Globodera rostochiensis TaxID=31243 RepID=A0A914IHC1_GLORO
MSAGDEKTSIVDNLSANRHRKFMRQGMGFLLQQIRGDSTSADAGASRLQNERPGIKRVASDATTSKKQIVTPLNEDTIPLAVGQKRENKELPTDVAFYDKMTPIQIVSDCFVEGTTPDFGPHIRRFIGENNYVRSCKWSSNGKWLVTDSVDRISRVFSFSDFTLTLQQKVSLGGLVYDVQWAPFSMQNHFVTTSRSQPIHCWDVNGELLTSYRGINDMDELENAYSLCFSLDGKRLFGGYCNRLRIFECERGGRQTEEIKTFGKFGGQKGIVSAISMCPRFDGIFAVATFNGSVGLYSTLTNSCDCLINGSSDGPAITHLQYSSDGNLLFAGLRKRAADTNQRFYFQVDPFDRYLYSGNSAGELLIFDLKKSGEEGGKDTGPTHSVKCSESAVVGLSLHPSLQLIALSTGQRVFPDLLPELFPENEWTSPTTDQSAQGSDVVRGNGAEVARCECTKGANGRKGRSELDNSVKLLRFS